MNKINNKDVHLKDALFGGIENLCQVFWGPNLDACGRMMAGDFFQPFELIFQSSKTKSSEIIDKTKSIMNKFDTSSILFDHLNECYIRLFVNSREGIAAPLYASCYEYENAPMMGKSAEEMTRRYASKGLSMEKICHEPPDHLAIELEYLFFLLHQGTESGFEEAKLFAKETMLPWVLSFKQRLKSIEEDCRFYSFMGEILVLFLFQLKEINLKSGE